MKQGIFTVEANCPIARNTFELILSGDVSAFTAPGQFADLLLPGFSLRRPISVCNLGESSLTLVYKTVGKGTEQMARLAPGEKMDLLTGLGNGYDILKSGEKPLLAGGGAGVPPLYYLAEKLLAEGKQPCAALGFNTKDEVFYEKKFRSLGIPVAVATVDGSHGVKGFVTDAVRSLGIFDSVFCCGPLPMLKAVYDFSDTPGQFSFEARMGCGFGACMGCTVRTKNGWKRICREGPVLEREEIAWTQE